MKIQNISNEMNKIHCKLVKSDLKFNVDLANLFFSNVLFRNSLKAIIMLFLLMMIKTHSNAQTLSLFGRAQYVDYKKDLFNCPMDINEWAYIAITKDNANGAKVYKNGQLIFTGNYAATSYNWSRLDLGAVFFTSYNGWFQGFIDEFRISNKVRTDSEISTNYNSGLPFSADANTIGLWHFDQSTGTAITASAGSGGSLTNAIWDTQGKFGNCISFNGTTARATINQAVPTSNMTVEFWIKPTILASSWPVSFYGMNTAGFSLTKDTLFSNHKKVEIDKNIEVYPNPASNQLFIKMSNWNINTKYNVIVSDLTGKKVIVAEVSKFNNNINLSANTRNGLYFISILDADGVLIEKKKIIIE